mgnify:FL=1
MPLKTEHKVGLFIIVTVLLVVAGLFFMAYKKGLFHKEYTYQLSSKTGEGLTLGMPVIFAGFKIGNVTDLELTEQGFVLVKFDVPSEHVRWLKADSRFILEKPLLGSPRINVRTENMGSPPLLATDRPEVTEVNDINETIKRFQPIIDKANQILENVEQITANLADPNGEVRGILRNAQKITGNFTDKKSALEIAVGDPQSIQAIYDSLRKLKDITARAEEILRKADAIAGKTDESVYGPEGLLSEISAILKDLLAKMKRLDVTLENVNKITTEASDAAKDLKVLRSDFDAGIRAIGDLANEIEKKIPFKKEPEIKLP